VWGTRARRRERSAGLIAVAEAPIDESPAAPVAAADPDGYDAGRDLADKAVYSACYAPSVSLYFDQHGDVRACCHNLTAVLGNIALSSIRDIWEGAAAERLRSALARRDLSRGCGVCEWQGRPGDGTVTFARAYDAFAVDSTTPYWPKTMEFAISNVCNLQCVMCTGWNSSAIRAHREHLPPIDNPYGEAFFEQVAEFLPHLEGVTLVGGEPFLGAGFLRLLEMIADLDRPPGVTVITNGTQWSERVQRICERVPLDFQLSLDAARRETFNAIRVGAEFDDVMRNLDHFRSYARRHGTTVGIGFCMMPDNALEFVELLELAESLELDAVRVNDVKFPPRYSPYHLPADELGALLDRLDQQVPRVDRLARFAPVWHAQRALLGAHHASITDPDDTSPVVPWTLPWEAGGADVARCREDLARWSGATPTIVRGDPSFNVVSIDGPLAPLAEPHLVDGDFPLTRFLDVVGQQFSARMSPAEVTSGEPNEVSFAGVVGDRVVVELRSFMFTDEAHLVALLAVKEAV